jgi:hypothetical protein
MIHDNLKLADLPESVPMNDSGVRRRYSEDELRTIGAKPSAKCTHANLVPIGDKPRLVPIRAKCTHSNLVPITYTGSKVTQEKTLDEFGYEELVF